MKKLWQYLKAVSWVRVAMLAICMVTVAVSTVPHAYSAYANALKAQFNMTQIQATVLSSLTLVSSMFALPGGALYDKLGVMPTVITSLLVTTIGWVGIWLTVISEKILPASYYYLLLTSAIAGHGRSYTEILVIPVSLSLVEDRAHYLVMVAMEMVYEIGPFAFTLVYELLFVNGHVSDPQNQSFGSFSLFIVITTSIVNIVATICFPIGQRYKTDDKTKAINGSSAWMRQAVTQQRRSQQRDATETTYLVFNNNESKCYKDIATGRYCLLVASMAIPMGVTFFMYMNITFLTASLYLDSYDKYLVLLQRIISFLVKIPCGVFVTSAKRFPFTNHSVVFVSNILIVACQILLLTCAENAVCFMISFVLVCLCQGTFSLMLPVIIASMFGTEFLGINLGLITSLGPIFSIVIQITFGKIYDAEIDGANSHYCYGSHCTRNFFIFTTCCCVFSLITAFPLLLKNIIKYVGTKREIDEQWELVQYS